MNGRPGARRSRQRDAWWRVYETTWTAVAGLTVLVAVCAALVVQGWALSALQAVGMAAAGAAVGACVTDEPSARPSRALRAGVAFGLMTPILVGLGTLVGAVALLLVLTGVVTHPALLLVMVEQVRRVRSARREPRVDPAELRDDELAREWRWSGHALRGAWTQPSEVERLSEVRRELLDEMTRRDPSTPARLDGR